MQTNPGADTARGASTDPCRTGSQRDPCVSPTMRPCSKTPLSRHRASSAPIRSSPTSICGTATIGTARPPTIWPRSAFHGCEGASGRRRLRDRTTAAVKSVLIEIGQILGSFEGKFAIIGGAVPWLLLGEAEMQHVGTADVDLGLNPAALGDSEYVRLVEALQEQATFNGTICGASNSCALSPPATTGPTSTSSSIS